MKLIRVFLYTITLFPLAACNPARIAPTQISTPAGTLQPVVAPSAMIIPFTEKVATSTPAASPISVTRTDEEAQEFPTLAPESLTITVIYDNIPFDPRLTTAWGFSALVEYGDHTLLFDSGGDGQILLENMRILGIDPGRIDSVVLSHAHEDHTGGLIALLGTGVQPVVYLLPSFPASFKHQIEQYAQVSEVSPGQPFGEGLWTTGEMGGAIPEQALVVQTQQGLVIITGCAHPGIVAMVEQAKELFAGPVHLVMGGFHLGDSSEAEINAILLNFRRLEVGQVAPCHCTGELAIRLFAAEHGEGFIQIGVGSLISLDGTDR